MGTRLQNEDHVFNSNWDALLRIFNKIPLDSVDQFESLKELAKTKQLSPRQMEGIIDRCNNAIAGNYGNTKKPENYAGAPKMSDISKAQSNGKH